MSWAGRVVYRWEQVHVELKIIYRYNTSVCQCCSQKYSLCWFTWQTNSLLLTGGEHIMLRQSNYITLFMIITTKAHIQVKVIWNVSNIAGNLWCNTGLYTHYDTRITSPDHFEIYKSRGYCRNMVISTSNVALRQ